jgi:pyruvate dehydrogenase E2 component (dihydrolipoamide acetyltransferase)
MSQEIIMPKLGLTMTHGKITRWLKKVGDPVASGEAVVEIETDKISSEVESPVDGFILKILAEEGEERDIIVPICIIGDQEELGGANKEVQMPDAAVNNSNGQDGAGRIPDAADRAGRIGKTGEASGSRIFITPIAKRLALEYGIDYLSIKGTGPIGRIVKKDILAVSSGSSDVYKADSRRIKITPVAKMLAGENEIEFGKIKGTGPDGRIVKADIISAVEILKNASTGLQADIPADPDKAGNRYGTGSVNDSSAIVIHGDSMDAAQPVQARESGITRRVPLAGIRKVIAQRLSQSKHDIPHVYFKSVIDVTNLVSLKEKLAENVKAKTGKKLSLNEMLIKAVAEALEEFADMNASLVGDEIVYHSGINIGMAVSIEKGLVVPVIQDANKLGLSQINRLAGELAVKARNGKLTSDDMTGGTFTISNLGAYDIDEFSAIINPPESAILAVGKAREIPWAMDGQIVARMAMTLTLSVDHRIIDGSMAAQFLKKLKDLLEEPHTLLV